MNKPYKVKLFVILVISFCSLSELSANNKNVFTYTPRIISTPEVINALNFVKKADVLVKKHKLKQAKINYQKALKILKEEVPYNDANIIIIMQRLAQLYKINGNYDFCEKLLLDALRLSLSQSLPNISNISVTNDLSTLYIYKAQYKDAELLLDQLFEHNKHLKQSIQSIPLQANLALIYAQTGRYKDAKALDELMLKKLLSQSIKDYSNITLSMYNLANIDVQQGFFDKAKKRLEEALVLVKRELPKNHKNKQLIMKTLGVICQQKGKYSCANSDRNRVSKVIDSFDRLIDINNQATLYIEQGRYDKALPLLIEARKLSENKLGFEHPTTLLIMNNLASIYEFKEDYEKATGLLLEAFHITKKLSNDNESSFIILNNLAYMYLRQGNYVKSKYYFNKVIDEKKMNHHPVFIMSMNGLGMVYEAQGLYEKSRSLLNKALITSKKLLGNQHPNTLLIIFNLTRLNIILKDSKRIEVLSSQYITGMEMFLTNELWGADEKTRLSYLYQQKIRQDFYLSIFIKNNNPYYAKQAIRISLLRKNLLLMFEKRIKKLTTHYNNKNLNKAVQELYATQKVLSEKFLSDKSNVAETDKIKEKIELLEQRIGKIAKNISPSDTTISFSEMLKFVQAKKATAVDYIIYNNLFEDSEQLLAVVVSPFKYPNIFLIPMGKMSYISEQIRKDRLNLENRHSSNDEQHIIGSILYNILWKPLLPYIQDKVYLIPDGIINLLPIETLIDTQEQYLLENHQLLLISSLSELKPENNFLGINKQNLIVFSNPQYNLDNSISLNHVRKNKTRGILADLYFSPLPGTRKEGNKILKQMRKKLPVQLYTEEKATEKKLYELQSPYFLHLATHAFFVKKPNTHVVDKFQKLALSLGMIHSHPNIQNPLLHSGLALYGANDGSKGKLLSDGTDGLLTAMEALHLDLSDTNLVVLSACNTGISIQQGNNFYGLRESFKVAGAKNILTTLWSIDDRVTSYFMNLFYHNLLLGISPQKSLLLTKQQFIKSKKWNHPYYWAPFVMVGSGK